MATIKDNGKHHHHYVFQGETPNVDVFQLLESRRVEAQGQIDVLHKRITELRDEMSEKMDKSHREIMHEIRLLREDQHRHAEEMSSRVGKLERWKWTIIGGAATFGFILAGGLDNLSKFL